MLEISDMIVLFLDRYLRREPEVGVDLDLRGPVRSARQRLHIRLEHVLAQGDPHLQPHSQSHPTLGAKELGTWNLEQFRTHLVWSSPSDTVAGSYNVPLVDQTATTSENFICHL